MGFGHIADMSSPEAPSDGLGTLEAIVDSNHKRVSAFDAFLPAEIARTREKNLSICTGVTVSRIAFSSGEMKRRAEKVHFQLTNKSKSVKMFSAKVNKEVIICSGALGSPQVLMLRYYSHILFFPKPFQYLC
jgi:choline dehydrogenase